MKRLLKWLTCAILFVILILGTYVAYLQLTGNIHTVIPGEVYRSGQLSPAQLQKVIDQDHLKAIIDLAPNDPAHAAELAVSQQNQVQHYDLQLYAYTYPSGNDLQQLNTLLQTAPRPFLVHCHGGSDRTGLAAAMVLAATPGYSDFAIKMQYSFLYLAIKPSSIGKQVMGRYFTYLQQNNLDSSPARFKAWLKRETSQS